LERLHPSPRPPAGRAAGADRPGPGLVLLGALLAPLAQAADRLGAVSPLALDPAQLGALQVESIAAPPIQYVETRSDRAISMGLDDLDPALDGLAPAAFRLDCPGEAEPRRPLRLGLDRQLVGYGDGKRPLYGARLHLLFERPLAPGVRCRLGLPAPLAGTVPVVYRSERTSGSIQVNQVGYCPDGPKRAYFGNWLGSAGPLPVDDPGFEAIDAVSGARVFGGRAQLRAAADPWSGNGVYEADFSGLRTPGRYRIRVGGLGLSDPFSIAPEVYGPVYRAVLRVFYHSRNGTPILAPWADPGHERPQGGVPAELDGLYHESVAGSALGCAESDCRRRPVSGGWFDAGDYGQYAVNAAPIWSFAEVGLDLAPGAFGDGDLGIPESGNRIPDLIDELDWGMTWLLAMQDRADGGVYSRLASRRWDSTLPHRLTEPRLIAEKTTHATASFAAAAAIHSRLIAPYRPERAKQAISAATLAWQFLETHPQWPGEGERYRNPPGMHAGEYADASALDNRLWAAAELYRTTADPQYRRAYEGLAPRVKLDPTAPVSYQDQSLAACWAYLLAGGTDRDPESVERARRALVASARWYERMAALHPYRAPMHGHIPFLGWGSFARSTRATVPLLQGFALTGDRALLMDAYASANPQLGANPLSISFITGIGARSPLRPLNKLSQYDSNERPLKGLPVPGPHWYVPGGWPELAAVNEAYSPGWRPAQEGSKDPSAYLGTYPALRRYTDSELIPQMSEPTVSDYGRVGIAFGLLAYRGLAASVATRASPGGASATPAGGGAR
jgi:hypothetical protein